MKVVKRDAMGKPPPHTKILPNWLALQGQFQKAKPDRKPTSSRNVPVLVKLTAVPANCWPLLEAQEAVTNMWTRSNTPPKGQTRKAHLSNPVSPLAESVNNDKVESLLQDSTQSKSSLQKLKRT